MVKYNKNTKRVISLITCITIAIGTVVFSVGGFSNGRFDRARTGCECHSSTADPTVTVDMAGQPVEYTPLQTYQLTITVSGGPVSTKGGFNLEVSTGTLSSNDPNVQTNGPKSQATHTNPNQRSWSVNWTAPSAGAGDVTFWIAGNAVNGNGNNGGDGWNLYSTIISEAPLPDVSPPEIANVLIDGVASRSVLVGTTVTLTTTVDDSNTGNSNINGANYTIDQANWSSSTSMDAVVAPFDNPTEDVTQTIDTTGWISGTYQIYVYAWDAVPNYNVSSSAYATLIIFTEQLPPKISNVQINGASTLTYSLSSIPTLTITATVDDSNTGNSDIAGANFTLGVQQWDSSKPMTLQNPPTSPTELFEATINPPEQAGTYSYYVYAWDSELNYNITNTDKYAILTLTDDLGPEIFNVLIDGLPSKGVAEGIIVTLTATIDDSNTGNSNIGGANFTVGQANWSSSTSMDAVLSPFDNPIEEVTQIIDTTGWLPGTYKIYVYAQDELVNFNFTSEAFATLVISSEQIPPEILDVKINGASTQTYSLSTIPTLILTATVDESNTGNSNVEGANYTLGAQQWDSSEPMTLLNPPTSPTEIFEATITPPNQTGTYRYYVYAWDADLNRNTTNIAEFATLIIIDDQAPVISDVLIDGITARTVIAGTHLSLTATVDDSSTGNSIVGGANYTIGAQNWTSSILIDAQIPPFDNPIESVIKTIDTSGWSPGTYEIYVYAWDDATPSKNYNLTSTSYIVITILESPVNVNVSTPSENGKLLISWDAASNEIIVGFNIYRSAISGGSYELIATVNSSVNSYTDINLEDETTYYYVLTAFDSGGNETSYSVEGSATTQPAIEPESKDSSNGIVWIILILIIVIAIILILILFMRKR